LQVEKPLDMYRIAMYPWLTVNFDGIAKMHGKFIPIEAKMVSPYGEKGWDWTKSWSPGMMVKPPAIPHDMQADKRCEIASKHYGIPAYYYCQLQQQMLGLGSPFGFMAALHDKDWTLRMYMVMRDNYLLLDLIRKSRTFWNTTIAPKKGLTIYPDTIEMQVPKLELARDEEY